VAGSTAKLWFCALTSMRPAARVGQCRLHGTAGVGWLQRARVGEGPRGIRANSRVVALCADLDAACSACGAVQVARHGRGWLAATRARWRGTQGCEGPTAELWPCALTSKRPAARVRGSVDQEDGGQVERSTRVWVGA